MKYKTEFAFGFDAVGSKKLCCFKYNKGDYSITRKEIVEIEDIVKPILLYMNHVNKNILELNGITITKNEIK